MLKQHMTDQQANDKPNDGLELTLSDFGPISRGTIDMRPLTILVGPNGCGKSHVTTLLHSIINAECMPDDFLDFGKKTSLGMTLVAEAARIMDAHKTGSNPVKSDICKTYAHKTLQVFYDLLAANFPGGYEKLVKSGKEHFDLGVKSRVLEGRIRYDGKISADINHKMHSTVNFKKSVSVNDLNMSRMIDKAGGTNSITIPDVSDGTIEASIILPALTARLLSTYPPRNRSVYFPAERGGLTLANKSLMLRFYGSMGAAHASSLDSEITNVSTQFLELLLDSDENKTEFAHFVDHFEETALHGSIVTQKNPNRFLTLAFKQDGRTLPLARSASSAKDLAVFLFYLRCVAKRGETVVLEEPETALYPDNQIRLARLIAILVNTGLNMIITTHSPYFLEQLSHCVMAGSSETGKTSEFPEKERLDKTKVAAYRFQVCDDGYEIMPISVDDEGIPQHDFIAASDRQYDELINLET